MAPIDAPSAFGATLLCVGSNFVALPHVTPVDRCRRRSLVGSHGQPDVGQQLSVEKPSATGRMVPAFIIAAAWALTASWTWTELRSQ